VPRACEGCSRSAQGGTRPEIAHHVDTAPSPVIGARLSGVSGISAVALTGDVVLELTGGHAWDFVAFGVDDDLLLAATSGSIKPDTNAIRAEVRAQRFAGVVLPHAGPSLAADHRHQMYAFFGRITDRVCVFGISRSSSERIFSAREVKAAELFLRQYGGLIVAAIFGHPDDAITDAIVPDDLVAFVVDADALLVGLPEGIETGLGTLSAALTPRAGKVPGILHPIVTELVSRYRDGLRGNDLVVALPFAFVRLTPMRTRGTVEFLVTLEQLRTGASLETAAARFSISKRELQVLLSMLRGIPVVEIAAELSISESTVVFHLKRMLKKTGSRNRTELAARMLGWTSE
jgi:DNA-binding CsgD family transcriptional regulator